MQRLTRDEIIKLIGAEIHYESDVTLLKADAIAFNILCILEEKKVLMLLDYEAKFLANDILESKERAIIIQRNQTPVYQCQRKVKSI